MTYNDPRPVLLRIAKLEEHLKAKPKTRFSLLKDSSKVLSICAFVISMVTTIYSWRKDEIQNREAARREFDSTMQQAVDLSLKSYDFQVRNKNEPNFGAMNSWFTTQMGLVQNRTIQTLAALDDASMFDYLMAGQFVVNTDPSKAATLMKRAIEIGLQKQQERNEFYFVIIAYITSKLFGEKIDISLSYEQRVHDLGSAYVTLGGALLLQKKDDEAGEVYEKAIQLYNDSNLTMAFKQYSISIIYKFWADSEAVAFLDCNSYLAHLQKAAEYFPEERKIATNLDWSSIQYELSYTSTYCASDGRLHPPVLPVSNFVEGITSNALLNWSSSNNQPTWPDGNNTGVQNSKSPSEKR